MGSYRTGRGSIAGNLTVDGAAVFNEPSADKDFRVESDGQTHMLFVDGGNDAIGIGTSDPGGEGQMVEIAGKLGYRSFTLATKADGYTMTRPESGCVVLQSTNGATITLPATIAGMKYTFVWVGTAGHTFNISPNASDKIMGSILDVANGNIVTAASSGAGADDKDLQLDSGSQIGDRVTLVADGSAGWYIVEALGSWVFES